MGAAKGRRRAEIALAYGLLLPSVLIIGLFGLIPLVSAGVISFRDWRLTPGPWVGFDNYARALLREPQFWQSLQVSAHYVLGTVPTTLVIAYLLAESLHGRLRGAGFFRTLYFLPYVVSPVAAAAVWRWILNPNFGVATAVTRRLGLDVRWLYEERGIGTLLFSAAGVGVPGWLAGPSLALVCIIGVTIWHNLGFAVVVMLAGLAAVPEEVVDAARLDGARGWTLARYVKLPLLSPTLFFLVVIFTIRAFQTFTQIYVLSPDRMGGPNGTTRNLTLYIYQCFNDQMARLGAGYGSAVALLLFGIVLSITLVQFRVIGRRVHYG